jgi:hypothetical protein
MNDRRLILLLSTLAWFVVVVWLAAKDVFKSGSDEPPLTIALAFLAPILLFLAALRIPRWRDLVLSVSPVFLIALNGWRFIGMAFLMGWAEGLLPGGFAWPAGLGDIAMAVTAPWVAARVAADDGFRFSREFLLWNLFGIADFLNAVFLGTIYMWPGIGPSISTALMQRLPFALIPAFFVPLIAMAHFTLIAQRRPARTTA